MKRSFIILYLFINMVSCGQNNYQKQAASRYYPNKEDKFGFLIFDNSKVEGFIKKYSPFVSENIKIKDRLNQLKAVDTFRSKRQDFDNYTKKPIPSDYILASKVMEAADSNSNQKTYFNVRLNYLFFFECLPDSFQNKWVQTQSGDFMFNVTFFNLMRTKCKVFDQHIYGTSGHWDDSIRQIFNNDNFNEITSEKALEIKECLITEESFRDINLQLDRQLFISILDNVIDKKWCLLLLDKN